MSEVIIAAEVSPEKQEIISSLNTAIEAYRDALKKLKTNHCLESRIMYGALIKDFSSSVYHANRQIQWIINETDTVKKEASNDN